MKNQTVRPGTLGWLRGGKRGMEAYLYILHRVTGLVLLAFLSLHVLVTSSRLFGEQTWEWAMGITHSPPSGWPNMRCSPLLFSMRSMGYGWQRSRWAS